MMICAVILYFHYLQQRIRIDSEIRLEAGGMNLNFLINSIPAVVSGLVSTAVDRGRVMEGMDLVRNPYAH